MVTDVASPPPPPPPLTTIITTTTTIIIIIIIIIITSQSIFTICVFKSVCAQTTTLQPTTGYRTANNYIFFLPSAHHWL